ncbi:MAG TPA: undecaprenyldiphospho-muramoylpentapeptide beta-N-acetylglucosaminyltransferase [Hanamia sp.]|nr:undecaprenyldiphospho-muramoylpentapeptide beta-N-acetylglucosaminyltransferase [Hanamia sp.]
MKIIIAGGGTGGHIFPALAIANALKNKMPEMKILFVGAKGKMEMEKIPAAGYKIAGLDIAGYNRSSLIKNIGLPFKLMKSFFQVRKIFKAFEPDAVVGVGGYSTFPVLRYAQSKKIPSFIHESNSLPGKSNIMLGKRATEIFVPSEGMEKYFLAEKIKVTGNPVREIFSKKVPKEEALKFFGLKPGIKTVFVMGGSLGAKSINDTIEENMDAFKKNTLQLIWQTGKNYQINVPKEEKMNIWTNAFIDKMENAYSAADVVVARSGAMTVAEICVVGKPAIFVPYPFAAEDHQTVNAMVLINKKAALIVPDKKVKNELFPCLMNLINDESLMQELGNNASEMSIKNADEVIAAEIIKQIK